MCEQLLYKSVGVIDAIEWACVLCGHHIKKWLSEWTNESASNFVLSSNIPLQKQFEWFRRLQLWATGDWQFHHHNARPLMHRILCRAKHEITQVTQPCFRPDLVPCNFLLFPKLKSPLKGKRFQIVNEIQENTTGQLMVTGRAVWGPEVPALKGTEASLSYVQCFLYLLQ